jgi:hypothetical protein
MIGAGSKAQMERAGGFVDGEETELKAGGSQNGTKFRSSSEARTRRGKERRGRSNRRIKAEVGPKVALSPGCLFACLPEPFLLLHSFLAYHRRDSIRLREVLTGRKKHKAPPPSTSSPFGSLSHGSKRGTPA